MQPFSFWSRLPEIPASPAKPTPLELAQLQAALDQATWTRYGVIAQIIAAVAAGVAIYFTHRAAVEAQRQANAAWEQLEGERARAKARSIVAAHQFLSEIDSRFHFLLYGDIESHPDPLGLSEGILEDAKRDRHSGVTMTTDALAAIGVEYSQHIAAPACVSSWLLVIDQIESLDEWIPGAKADREITGDYRGDFLRKELERLHIAVASLWLNLREWSRPSDLPEAPLPNWARKALAPPAWTHPPASGKAAGDEPAA